MDIKKYLITNEYFTYMSQAETLGPSNMWIEILKIRREELRKRNEESPRECPEDITEDFRFIAGMISMCNFLLSLPERSRTEIKKVEGE